MLPQNPYSVKYLPLPIAAAKEIDNKWEFIAWEDGYDTLKQWLFEPCTEHPYDSFDEIGTGEYEISECALAAKYPKIFDGSLTESQYSYWKHRLGNAKKNIDCRFEVTKLKPTKKYHEHRYQCPECMQELKQGINC